MKSIDDKYDEKNLGLRFRSVFTRPPNMDNIWRPKTNRTFKNFALEIICLHSELISLKIKTALFWIQGLFRQEKISR